MWIKTKSKPFVVSGAIAIGTAIASVGAGTLIAGASAIASGVGTVASLNKQKSAMKAQQRQADASQRAEDIRRKQMIAEAKQRQLAQQRQNTISMSQARSNIVSSGADFGSSAEGALGGVYSTFATDISNTRTALGFGQQLFAANADYSVAQGQSSFALGQASMYQDIGRGFGDFAKLGIGLFSDISNSSSGWTTTTTEG